MAKIEKLKNKNNELLYPATIVDAIYDNDKEQPLSDTIQNLQEGINNKIFQFTAIVDELDEEYNPEYHIKYSQHSYEITTEKSWFVNGIAIEGLLTNIVVYLPGGLSRIDQERLYWAQLEYDEKWYLKSQQGESTGSECYLMQAVQTGDTIPDGDDVYWTYDKSKVQVDISPIANFYIKEGDIFYLTTSYGSYEEDTFYKAHINTEESKVEYTKIAKGSDFSLYSILNTKYLYKHQNSQLIKIEPDKDYYFNIITINENDVLTSNHVQKRIKFCNGRGTNAVPNYIYTQVADYNGLQIDVQCDEDTITLNNSNQLVANIHPDWNADSGKNYIANKPTIGTGLSSNDYTTAEKTKLAATPTFTFDSLTGTLTITTV